MTKIEIDPMCVREGNWNARPCHLTDRESLHIFGTVSFGANFIAGTIDTSPNAIEAGMWLALVPLVYRDDVLRGIEIVFREFDGELMRDREVLVSRFALAMSAWIHENVRPR